MKTARIVLFSVGGTLLVVLLVLRWAVQRDRLSSLPTTMQQAGGTMQPAGASPVPSELTTSSVGQGGRYKWPPAPVVPNPGGGATNSPETNAGPAPAQPPSPPPVAPVAADARPSQPGGPISATEGAVITGTVVFDGPPSPRTVINMDRDPHCASLNADIPPLSEEVIVNPNGTLADVFVYIQDGLKGRTFEPPSTPVYLDQLNCRFAPHVFGMMAGQPLTIRNYDPLLHNAHAMTRNNAEFNVGQPNQGMQTTKRFANPEVMVHMKCDIHPWMSAYIGVLDHPFFSVTGSDGAFVIGGLPPGTYVVAAWQEKYGSQTQTVTVGENEAKSITFTYSP